MMVATATLSPLGELEKGAEGVKAKQKLLTSPRSQVLVEFEVCFFSTIKTNFLSRII